MKTTSHLILVTFLGLSSISASAKKKEDSTTTATYGCARFDVNENGVLDPTEIEALRKAFSEGDTALKPLDINNDGKLDDSEVALIKLPKQGKDKKKKKNA